MSVDNIIEHSVGGTDDKNNLQLFYCSKLFKEIVEKELLERKYDNVVIKEWLDNI
jgi:hypothetical protein